jgi:hypothetical protein
MPYVSFHDHFPEVAERETRTVFILDDSPYDLPPGPYTLIEMYCNEPGCDCRRVFFCVVSPHRRHALAVVAYGWENRDFYERWFGHYDPEEIDVLKGPALNLASPQSDLAPAIMDMIQCTVLQDELYVERLKTHYKMFREKIDKEGVPGPPRATASRKRRTKRRHKRKR